jgi:hypothetical protein
MTENEKIEKVIISLFLSSFIRKKNYEFIECEIMLLVLSSFWLLEFYVEGIVVLYHFFFSIFEYIVYMFKIGEQKVMRQRF